MLPQRRLNLPSRCRRRITMINPPRKYQAKPKRAHPLLLRKPAKSLPLLPPAPVWTPSDECNWTYDLLNARSPIRALLRHRKRPAPVQNGLVNRRYSKSDSSPPSQLAANTPHGVCTCSLDGRLFGCRERDEALTRGLLLSLLTPAIRPRLFSRASLILKTLRRISPLFPVQGLL